MYFITLEKKDDFLFNLKQVIKSIFKATILLPALATIALVFLSPFIKKKSAAFKATYIVCCLHFSLMRTLY